jgi:hypothetical protein
VLAGAVRLAFAVSALPVMLKVLPIASGVDLIVTGGLGHSPLYRNSATCPIAEEVDMTGSRSTTRHRPEPDEDTQCAPSRSPRSSDQW